MHSRYCKDSLQLIGSLDAARPCLLLDDATRFRGVNLPRNAGRFLLMISGAFSFARHADFSVICGPGNIWRVSAETLSEVNRCAARSGGE
jgi:hypothetical protein